MVQDRTIVAKTPLTGARARAGADATQSWLSVVRAYNLSDAVMSARLAVLGVRVAEHEVLANLHRTPDLTQQQLAQRCFVAKSGISMLVSRMAADGLVRRTPDAADGRVRRLALTARGDALARRTVALQREVVAAMAEALSPAEMATVHGAMERVCVRLEAMRDRAAAY
jgi:DNA-binding MarR family transcriptional regulator